MVIGFGELRRGTSIELDGVPYKVEEYSQQKMQQRAPVYRIKLRNLLSGQLIERSFSGYGIKLNIAEVENRTVPTALRRRRRIPLHGTRRASSSIPSIATRWATP